MRPVIYAINLTLDGCCDHTAVSGSDEILDYFTRLLRESDLLVYGRKTYELMVPYWPDVARAGVESKASLEFAGTFDALDKLVFSRTLASGAEAKTRVVGTEPGAEIARLKRGAGKSILVGGVTIPAQLAAAGLIDEYRFVIHPTLAGTGRRLWDNARLPDHPPLRLELCERLPSGCVALRYLRA
ncbi:MAG: dihydrofolate reductase family protein [Terriglobales bacterium]